MRKNIVLYLFLIASIALGLLLGYQTLATPRVVSIASGELSSERMAGHLETIAAEYRSVLHIERRMYVRDYIIDNMESHGLEAWVDEFEVSYEDYIRRHLNRQQERGWPQATTELWLGYLEEHGYEHFPLIGWNMLFRQQGRSDTAIMLMAHIDSASLHHVFHPDSDQESLGAADSGYGLALMLELARYFAGRELENTIYFFFTDLEEMGLLGAYHAVETMDFSNVAMILNLEARGVRGPVHMFETHAGDFAAIRFFRDALAGTNAQPMAYSFAAAIYREMPNATDLTPFLNLGFAGMNFAPLDSLMYYHTYRDNLDNISLTTMQHYINMIGALTEAFAMDARFADVNYFASEQGGVYFPLPFGIFVLYTDTTAAIIGFAMLAITLAAAFFFKNTFRLCKVLIWMIIVLLSMLAGAAFGLGISFVVSLITDVPFNPTFMRNSAEIVIMWPSVAAAMLLYVFLHKLLAKKFSRNEMAFGAILLLAVINVALNFILIEATPLTLVPLATALIGFLLSKIPSMKRRKSLYAICAAIPTILTIMLFAPIIHTLTLALTIGGLAIFVLITILMLAALPALWLRCDLDENKMV